MRKQYTLEEKSYKEDNGINRKNTTNVGYVEPRPNALNDVKKSVVTSGVSAVSEPELGTPITTPNVAVFDLDNPQGGIPINNGNAVSEIPLNSGSDNGATDSGYTTGMPKVLELPKKKFPYWIIAVAVVGGYLVFRKK